MAGLIGVGYQGRTLSEFVDGLVAQDVTELVDVRMTPISRKPGFSKAALSVALDQAGIGYRHRPALGNPKDNRAGFSGGPLELATARAAYARWISGPQARRALEEIATLAMEEVVAVMCFEADQSRCHRDVVIAALGRSVR
jgi:uncharacterized protein (DUF488 family)